MGDADSAQQEPRLGDDDEDMKSEHDQLLEDFNEGNGGGGGGGSGQRASPEAEIQSIGNIPISVEMQAMEEGGLMVSGMSAPEFKERPSSSTMNSSKSRSAPRLDKL